MTVAGLPLVKTLETLKKSPPSRSDRKHLDTVIQAIELGATFTDGLRQTGRWLAPFDHALIEAGEKSGRLDQCFGLLSQYYADRAVISRRVMSGLWYPAFMLHAACFVTPFPAFMLDKISFDQYLQQALTPLICVYVIVFGLILAGQSRWGGPWRAAIELFCRFIPLVGSARKHLSLARLAMSLEALLSAGVNIIQSWELASVASGSPALARAVERWLPRVREGEQTPGEVLPDCREIPELFANLYHTGEISGQLDDTLVRLRTYHQEEGSRQMQMIAEWAPRVVYLIIAAFVVKMIFQLAGNYMNTIGNAINSI